MKASRAPTNSGEIPLASKYLQLPCQLDLTLLIVHTDKKVITTEELVPYRPLIFRQMLREMSSLVTEAQTRGWPLDSAKNIVRNVLALQIFRKDSSRS